jgi:AcrR family transcriptional regulator
MVHSVAMGRASHSPEAAKTQVSRSDQPDADDPRARLLAKVVVYGGHHGLSDLSLRELAAAVGTSHRMLLYHFGSKEGLMVAVVQAVEAAQRDALAELAADRGLDDPDAIRTMWRRLADPAMWPRERLFYEMYGQALQGRPGTTSLLDGIVDEWVDETSHYAIASGTPESVARVEARLGVAVVRGLLLDLLATGDREAVDAAMEHYITRYVARSGTGPGSEIASV